ncbi:tRNA (adenosine(37)-N6)-dimethylallyltransferase MiaA [Campylobacter sp. 9BO]|uniref:tRNA (adenosine(37)-N6)-dimethylallyltransferase MiaA n=1 Tax=Campylobacter sp. 9BO TaxID=3424759 RepID=UPI003D33F182
MFKQLAIIGTTASGKSTLAIELAKKTQSVILSLDSLCLYKQINIASAKPTLDELASVRHFGINEISVDENFSAGMFFEIYKKSLAYAKQADVALIITGGSGFYLKAMLSGLTPDVAKCKTPSNAEIYELASKIDPKFLQKISQNDSYRLEKWYQIYTFSKTVPSLWLEQNTKPPLISELEIYEILWDVQELRERIKLRTKLMLEQGLLDEARMLFNKFSPECKPLKSIGLKECGEFLNELIENEDKLCELISVHTAQLAKRQRTFNRSQFKRKFIGNLEEVKNQAIKYLKD